MRVHPRRGRTGRIQLRARLPGDTAGPLRLRRPRGADGGHRRARRGVPPAAGRLLLRLCPRPGRRRPHQPEPAHGHGRLHQADPPRALHRPLQRGVPAGAHDERQRLRADPHPQGGRHPQERRPGGRAHRVRRLAVRPGRGDRAAVVPAPRPRRRPVMAPGQGPRPAQGRGAREQLQRDHGARRGHADPARLRGRGRAQPGHRGEHARVLARELHVRAGRHPDGGDPGDPGGPEPAPARRAVLPGVAGGCPRRLPLPAHLHDAPAHAAADQRRLHRPDGVSEPQDRA